MSFPPPPPRSFLAPAAAGSGAIGSYVAIGTFHPSIEIWNLDVIDSLEPAAVLGGFQNEAAALKKAKSKAGKKKAPVRRRRGAVPRCLGFSAIQMLTVT